MTYTQKFLCIILSILTSISNFAQNAPRPDIDLDDFILEFFPIQESDDIQYEDVYEALFQYYRTPLNLNRADRNELQALFVLSELQINALLEHIEKNGKLLTLYELQAVPFFDPLTIQKLLPFTTVIDEGVGASSLSLWQRLKNEKDNHYLIMRYDQTLEERRGYTPPDTNSDGSLSSRYRGSPQRVYARYRIKHPKDFSFGFTLEKDAGEELIWDTQTNRYGADYISYHAFLENKGRFKKIAIGDYQMQFGQGLLLAGGFAVGKGAETVQTIRRSNLGLRPYTSTLESGFMRGIAATYNVNNFEVTGFYSNLRRDANVLTQGDTLTETESFIETLQATGFHRTLNEINAKGNIREQTLGGNILYKSNDRNLEIGGTAIFTNYDVPLQRRDRIYNRFEFSGQENYNVGLNFSYNWQNFNFFGEIAQSKSGGRGGVGGFVSSLAPNVEMAVLYRNYDKDFHTFYGSAIAEGSRNINEKGMYWGLKVKPTKKLQINAYYDKFQFDWLRFGADAPSEGYEFLTRATYKFSRKISAFGQYRQEMKELNLGDNESQIDFLVNHLRRNYIFNLDYKAEKILTLKTRFQGSSYKEGDLPTTYGYAIVQDVGVQLWKLKFDTRFALFDTDNFDNRQYIYEKDVLWFFSIPAYNGVGFRNYFLLRYKHSQKLDFWIRYAYYKFQNQETISSGLEQINGNRRSEIRMQMRVKF